MNRNGELAKRERASILQKVIATARREITVASLEALAVHAAGDEDQRAIVHAQLLALRTIIDNALAELETIYMRQPEGEVGRNAHFCSPSARKESVLAAGLIRAGRLTLGMLVGVEIYRLVSGSALALTHRGEPGDT
jgi:hypothetical protein